MLFDRLVHHLLSNTHVSALYIDLFAELQMRLEGLEGLEESEQACGRFDQELLRGAQSKERAGRVDAPQARLGAQNSRDHRVLDPHRLLDAQGRHHRQMLRFYHSLFGKLLVRLYDKLDCASCQIYSTQGKRKFLFV